MLLEHPCDEHGLTDDSTDLEEAFDRVDFRFALEASRRDFLKILGAGLVIGVAAWDAEAQERQGRQGGRPGGGGGGPKNLSARVHIANDGTITVMTGKVECGQGARAEISQAAAEELGVSVERVRLIMADTSLVPDDGGTFGSRTTPGTLPSIRVGCAAARELLRGLAAKRTGADLQAIAVREGEARAAGKPLGVAYADLAVDASSAAAFSGSIPAGATLTVVKEWKVMGAPVPRPNGADIVTGVHQYPSDIRREGMVYGKVLRPPTLGASLKSIDPEPAKAFPGVSVVRDNGFVGVIARNTHAAQAAIEAIAKTAQWDEKPAPAPAPSSTEIYAYLRKHAQGDTSNRNQSLLKTEPRSHRAEFDVAYVQHCPMEPRAAVAEWSGDRLTVWTGGQVPFGVKSELARAFGLADDKVRVIVPDFGGGFGGKHSGECAVEAARLAKSAGKPVSLRWTRAEEFTWAQFRPAAAINAEATLSDKGMITSWHFININSGPSSLQTPYRVGASDCRFVAGQSPLRHGSYRGLAATANSFAREVFMDELAVLAGKDPLEFRMAHLEPGRLADALEQVAQRFDWKRKVAERKPNYGVGMACSIDKGSFVAACAQVRVDLGSGAIDVERITQTFDCGKIINPENLMSQVKGAIIMGLGPALREQVRFSNGKIETNSFKQYEVPRFLDVPELDVHLIDRSDAAPAGAGETPLIAVAPAIANAVFQACGKRIRTMPIRLGQSVATSS